MANWCGTCRSNYFRVKDAEKFKAWLELFPEAQLITTTAGEDTLYGFIEGGDGYVPSRQPQLLAGDGTEQDELDYGAPEISILGEIGQHLQDTEVCIIMETGAEKSRYVTGQAWAINPLGDTLHLTIDNIYEMAKTQYGEGVTITRCET